MEVKPGVLWREDINKVSSSGNIRGTSGLLVKLLACNRKVTGSSLTKKKLFFAYEYTQLRSTLKNEEVFIITSFSGFLVKPHLVKLLVEKSPKSALFAHFLRM